MRFLPWVLALFTFDAESAVENVSGRLGGSVYLTVPGTLPVNHRTQWSFNATAIAIISTGSPTIVTPLYQDRCEAFPNGTLRLDKLTTADNGQYTVTVLNLDTLGDQTHLIQLTVFELLSSPDLTVNSSDPLENDNVTLICDGRNQTMTSYTFYRDNREVSCSSPNVICTGHFLYFIPIKESDSGIYTCKISNPISSSTSAPLSLTVRAKVSNVTLTSNTSNPVYVDKDSVFLTCSAYGTNVSYSWSLQGAPILPNSQYHFTNNNSTLVISPVTRRDNESFTCTATNSLNSMTSSGLNLSWYPNGTILCDARPSNNGVQLLCSWPGGYPAANVSLMFNNQRKTEMDQVTYDLAQNVIPLNKELSCEGTQGTLTQSCVLSINTPESPGFKNESNTVGFLGLSITLTLNLNSKGALKSKASSPSIQILPATFIWYRLTPDPSPVPEGGNFSVKSSEHESSLTVTSVSEETAGRYMCTARNLLGSNNFVFTVTVDKVPEQKGELGPGEIAGIVIGVIAGLTIIGIVVFFITKANRNSTTASTCNNKMINPQNIYENTIPGVIPNSTNMESNYEELQHRNRAVYSDLRPMHSGTIKRKILRGAELESNQAGRVWLELRLINHFQGCYIDSKHPEIPKRYLVPSGEVVLTPAGPPK
ncbi:cell adhesion molecule CEACAM1-like [Discoglossus pictus]